ncbi:hypothetical protein PR003_g661 [Phytophthora rubi]|uniref:Uncharacterized protein n=1 Tax=Phytophthora rubi TaxID=129364 RepID=A0A6A4G2K6_9STRA|nr:hypothetical protein PR003_g661 [Phytophthora rubi]
MTRVLTQPPSLLVSLLHLVLCHPLTGVQCLYPKNVPNKRLQLRSVQQRKKARARTMEIRHRQLAFNGRETLDQVGKRQCGTEADAKGRLRNTIHQDESELPAPDSEDESPALGSEDDDIEVVTGMLDAMVIDAGVETEISDGDPDIASEVKNRVSNKGTEGIPYEMMFGARPDIHHIRKFGALAYVHVPVSPGRRKRQAGICSRLCGRCRGVQSIFPGGEDGKVRVGSPCR